MKRAAAVLIVLQLAACATLEPAPPGSRGKLLLAQQPGIRDTDRLCELFELESKDEAHDLRAAVARYARFEDEAHDEIRAALVRAGFAVTDAAPGPEADAALESEAGLRHNGRLAGGGGPLLRFRITDLGYSPRAWKGWYAAWEISSTLAVAAVAYAVPKSRPIAGAYLLEESIEELAEGYAGFWLLDRIWAPVRLESTMTDLRTGAVLWSGAETGFADFGVGRIFRRPRGADQDEQLGRSLRDAAEGLVADLQRSLR